MNHICGNIIHHLYIIVNYYSCSVTYIVSQNLHLNHLLACGTKDEKGCYMNLYSQPSPSSSVAAAAMDRIEMTLGEGSHQVKTVKKHPPSNILVISAAKSHPYTLFIIAIKSSTLPIITKQSTGKPCPFSSGCMWLVDAGKGRILLVVPGLAWRSLIFIFILKRVF